MPCKRFVSLAGRARLAGLKDCMLCRQKFELVRSKAEDLAASLRAIQGSPVDVQDAGMRFTLDVIVLVSSRACQARQHCQACELRPSLLSSPALGTTSRRSTSASQTVWWRCCRAHLRRFRCA